MTLVKGGGWVGIPLPCYGGRFRQKVRRSFTRCGNTAPARYYRAIARGEQRTALPKKNTVPGGSPPTPNARPRRPPQRQTRLETPAADGSKEALAAQRRTMSLYPRCFASTLVPLTADPTMEPAKQAAISDEGHVINLAVLEESLSDLSEMDDWDDGDFEEDELEALPKPWAAGRTAAAATSSGGGGSSTQRAPSRASSISSSSYSRQELVAFEEAVHDGASEDCRRRPP